MCAAVPIRIMSCSEYPEVSLIAKALSNKSFTKSVEPLLCNQEMEHGSKTLPF